MGFLDRLRGLLGEGSGREEDPRRAVDRIVRELKQHLSQGRARVAAAVRDEKRLERECVRASGEIQRMIQAAKVRLTRGDEAGARRCLARKVQAQHLLEEFELELERQRQAIGLLKEGLSDLADRLRKLQARRSALKTRHRRAKALQARAERLEKDRAGEAEGLMDELRIRLDVEEELLGAGGAGDALERRFEELEHSGEFKVKALEDLRRRLDEPGNP